ncbi:MAG: imidazole glycerol phosphate synthase subunit HisH [Chloroflexota bacterium]
MIAIIDYGAGNIRSVVNAVTYLGYHPKVTGNPDEVLGARAVILPGVGAAADTVASLKRLGLVEPVLQCIAEKHPFLGVCIGLQVLFTGTEEGGWHECLDALSGRVVRLPPGQKVPHMGWNQVHQVVAHPVFRGIPDGTNFYFVHSFYAVPDDKSLVAGETEYGLSFCSVIARGNLVATQFHPEKSGEYGLRFYDNFLRFVGVSKDKPARDGERC